LTNPDEMVWKWHGVRKLTGLSVHVLLS